jgi:hypothetical protein
MLFVSSDYLDSAYYSYAYKYNIPLVVLLVWWVRTTMYMWMTIGSNFNQLAMASGSFIKK